jgi:M6 family metalloprotease-like protein
MPASGFPRAGLISRAMRSLLWLGCLGWAFLSAAGSLPPLDPQRVRDQDDMTWEDYRPIPGTNWADPGRAGARTIRIAVVVADFPDHPFVVTLPKHSDPFGNPQIVPIRREEVARFYADFWNKPSELNRGHTVHEYWMEVSHGRIGVRMDPYGPYRMPRPICEYGMNQYGQQNSLPAGATPGGQLENDIDALWRAEAGANVRQQYDLVLRIFAGYDETCVWQEFGEMKFQTRDDITPEWGNPDPTKPRWAPTRYVPWTSWRAAQYLWSQSSIIQGECSGSIRHEITHAAFRIGDNNNNPYVQPYRRAGSGPWDIMDRGSFNGPGGPHSRWYIPVTHGGAMPAGLMLRQKIAFDFLQPQQVLRVNRNGLAATGLVVTTITAREVELPPAALAGLLVRLDGPAPQDRTPPDNPATNPLSSGTPNYNFYTLEVVQRIGYDSFCPDSGVLLAKNKDQASSTGGPNGFACFNWVIDAHPQDINVLDFKRPNGEPVMRTIADYRQLNDALFHAGLNSGSKYEWVDEPNRLHFYIIDLHRDDRGIMSYTVGVRSLDGAGPQVRGVALADAPAVTVAAAPTPVEFTLRNTGRAVATDRELHPDDARAWLDSDIYRLSVTVDGPGWTADLPNALAAVKFGESAKVAVYVSRTEGGAPAATVTLKAVSESDPGKTATATARVSTP